MNDSQVAFTRVIDVVTTFTPLEVPQNRIALP